jgi:hypothetical protein
MSASEEKMTHEKRVSRHHRPVAVNVSGAADPPSTCVPKRLAADHRLD